MMNFGAANDAYYTPADNSRAWDAFVDYCEQEGLDYEAEDFEQWVEDEREAAAERYAEWRREDAMERAMDYDRGME